MSIIDKEKKEIILKIKKEESFEKIDIYKETYFYDVNDDNSISEMVADNIPEVIREMESIKECKLDEELVRTIIKTAFIARKREEDDGHGIASKGPIDFQYVM